MLASDIDHLAAFATTAEESLDEIKCSGKVDPHSALGQALQTAHTAVDNLLGAFNKEIRDHQCAAFGCTLVGSEDDMYNCDHCQQWVCQQHCHDDGLDGIICDDCREAHNDYRDMVRQVTAVNDVDIAAINKGR